MNRYRTLAVGRSLNVDLLLSSGAVEGPCRRSHPYTLTPLRRLARMWRALLRSINPRKFP